MSKFQLPLTIVDIVLPQNYIFPYCVFVCDASVEIWNKRATRSFPDVIYLHKSYFLGFLGEGKSRTR